MAEEKGILIIGAGNWWSPTAIEFKRSKASIPITAANFDCTHETELTSIGISIMQTLQYPATLRNIVPANPTQTFEHFPANKLQLKKFTRMMASVTGIKLSEPGSIYHT